MLMKFIEVLPREQKLDRERLHTGGKAKGFGPGVFHVIHGKVARWVPHSIFLGRSRSLR